MERMLLYDKALTDEQVRNLTYPVRSDLKRYIIGRLKYIVKSGCPIEDNDNAVIEWIIRDGRDTALINEAFTTVIEVNKSFVVKALLAMKVEQQDFEDYMSEANVVIWSNIKDYDHTISSITTFFRKRIQRALFELRNDGTRYNASITKRTISARDELIDNGIVNPTSAQIARHINMTNPFYKPISEKQVYSALLKYHISVDMDINYTDDRYDPERAVLQNEFEERVENACNDSHWAIRLMYDIIKEIVYDRTGKGLLSDKEVSRALSYEGLREEFNKRSGQNMSLDVIKKLHEDLKATLLRKGLGTTSYKPKGIEGRVSTFRITDFSMYEDTEDQIRSLIEEDGVAVV